MTSPTRLSDDRPKSKDALPIAIVGGGLGGLALAIGLCKHDINVHIYEAAPAFSEIGAGVAFGLNSTTALYLIDPRLLKGYLKHATFNADRERDGIFATVRWGMDERKENGHKTGDIIYDLDDKWMAERAQKLGVRARSCIHRARLLEELVALIPEGVTSFRKSCETIEEQADGSLKLHFADGTSALASAVIGCDGIKSKTREFVCGPDVQATYAGECAFRAMVPRADAEAALGTNLALNGNLYCGYGGYIIHYPVEHGDLINLVAVAHDSGDTWKWEQDEWTVPATKEEFVQRFEGWSPPLVDIISCYQIPAKWALFNLRHDALYYKGRICLLGDSAHATTPHLGAGAGMAMEDAYILSNLVATVTDIQDIEKAFRAYDAVRRPRTQEVVERSLDAAIGYHFLLPGIGDDTAVVMERAEKSFKWLWHEDLEAQLEKAKKLLVTL